MSIINIFSKLSYNDLVHLIKTEIYNKKCTNRFNSPITSDLAICLQNNNLDIIKYLKIYFKIYQKLIDNKEKHVNALASRLIPWSFNINKSPIKSGDIPSKLSIDKDRWANLINQIINVISHMDNHDLLYGRMILCESIAHRCSDMLYKFGIYEKEMESNYNEAYLIALRLNRSKQMHSSMYYQYMAWKRTGNINKAKRYAKLMTCIPCKSPPTWPQKKKECEQYIFSQDSP